MVFLGGAWLQQDIDMHCDMSRVYVRPVQHLEPEQTTWLVSNSFRFVSFTVRSM